MVEYIESGVFNTVGGSLNLIEFFELARKILIQEKLFVGVP